MEQSSRQVAHGVFLQLISNPKVLFNIGAGVVLFALASLASLRVLRRLPDFEAKREMEWGARWFWLLLLSAFGLAGIVIYVGMTHTRYLTTSGLVSKMVFDALALSWAVFLPRQTQGWAVWTGALEARIRGREFDFWAWMQKTARVRRKLTTRAGQAVAVTLVLLGNVYLMLGFSYPFDGQWARWRAGEEHAAAVEQAVEEELVSSRIKSVDASAPFSLMNLGSIESAGSLTTVKVSLMRILDVGDQEEGFPTDPYRINLDFRGRVTELEAIDVVVHVWRIFDASDEDERWIISAGNRSSEVSVNAAYPMGEWSAEHFDFVRSLAPDLGFQPKILTDDEVQDELRAREE